MIHIGHDPIRTSMNTFLHIAPEARASRSTGYVRGGLRGIRARLRGMAPEQWGAVRTREAELAGYGVRWDEAELDILLALELRDHRAARLQSPMAQTHVIDMTRGRR